MFIKKTYFLFLSLFFSSILLFSEKMPNFFLEEEESDFLNKLFTVDIGIMRFKKNGNINDIKPLDSEEIMNSFKNEFELIQAIKLSDEEALLKAWSFFKKNSSSDSINTDSILEDQIRYQNNSIFSKKKATKIVLTKMKASSDYVSISNKWYENYKRAVFSLNVLKFIDRQVVPYNNICKNSSTPIDILVTGEIEKIEQGYLVSVEFYSYLIDKIFFKGAFVCHKESIANDVSNFVKQNAAKIFRVNYATLELDTKDNECEIYADYAYLGKGKIAIDYIVPGKYLFSFLTKGSSSYKEVIEVFPNEEKKVLVKPELHQYLQTIFFNVEPAGTKIFVNSQFRGITPFWDSLPKGEYILSTKTDSYHQDYRYSFSIDEIKEDDMNFSFHLMTKDLSKEFKIKKSLYYCAFWNFTFSLVTTIPLVIIATDYYNKASLSSEYYASYVQSQLDSDPDYSAVPFIETDYGKEIYNLSEALRFLSIGIAIYTVLSLGWLFYSLFDYINILEKKDFIPLISFYSTNDKKTVSIGGKFSLGKKKKP